MEIERPNALPMTKQELSDLEALKRVVEHAIDDGVLTPQESQAIKHCLWKDGKITPQELEIVQALIWDKVQTGELTYSW